MNCLVKSLAANIAFERPLFCMFCAHGMIKSRIQFCHVLWLSSTTVICSICCQEYLSFFFAQQHFFLVNPKFISTLYAKK